MQVGRFVQSTCQDNYSMHRKVSVFNILTSKIYLRKHRGPENYEKGKFPHVPPVMGGALRHQTRTWVRLYTVVCSINWCGTSGPAIKPLVGIRKRIRKKTPDRSTYSRLVDIRVSHLISSKRKFVIFGENCSSTTLWTINWTNGWPVWAKKGGVWQVGY